jgi:hypothetical protein
MDVLLSLGIALGLMLPFTAAFLHHTNKVGTGD